MTDRPSPPRTDEDPIRFSLNVPVPGRVAAIASELRPALDPFETVRQRHTLVVKRLGEAERTGLGKRVRRALAGAPAFEARVADIDVFDEPVAGAAPVVYLAVESPGLRDVHRRLCETFAPVPGIEGEDYVPHVTLARGGGPGVEAAVERLVGADIEPVTWVVQELVFWDARHDEVTGRIALPV